MGGIGLVLNVAKDALLTQQYAVDVVSHNIANVSTEGFTRQSPVISANDAAPYGGFMFGRGASLDEIIRIGNDFIEKRVQQSQTDLSSLTEKEIYMNVMEGVFNENSSQSLSSQFIGFWNAWNDLANNPSGLSERNLLVESGELLCQSFKSLNSDLTTLIQEIDNSIEAGIGEMNQIITQIADLNDRILTLQIEGNPNDLIDQRNLLVRQLSEYMDINTYEQDDGNLTVATGRGYILVSRNSTYPLAYENNEVVWQSSSSTTVTISDTVSGGKMGAWLEMRDEMIPKYQADINSLAESTIWEVNALHTQGIGLQGLTSVTGSYATTNSAEEIGTVDSGFNYYDKIQDGSFDIWLYDTTGAVVGSTTISITANTTTLDALATAIDGVSIGGEDALTASISVDGNLSIAVDTASGYSGYTLAFANDTSNTLGVLGINTFFTGTDAHDMTVNSVISANEDLIAAAQVDTTGAFTTGNNSNALDIAGLQYQGATVQRWTYERGSAATAQDITNTTLETYLHSLVGAIGIESRSTRNEKEYCEVIYNKLNETRDNISAVSLDEEMANLIKYQHAYTAAAKLISVADEMLTTILQAK
ncbi:MAG: flagellar hook-associated protein FlgK [Deltaproteobacteria bacterium]|nr:flagellar hook-associated protein FlgK [Deltaproteobacteria bacterium]